MRSNRSLSAALRALCVILSVGISLSVAGCSDTAEDKETVAPETTKVSVSGTGDDIPQIKYDKPFVFAEPTSEILWEGSGEKVSQGDWVLLRFYAEDPETSDVVRNDFLEVPVAFRMEAKQLGAELYKLLVDKPVGTRAVQVTGTEDETNVIVVDMLSAYSSGEKRPQDPALPQVAYDADGTPRISIPKGVKKPKELVVQQLRSGSSEQVEQGAQVVLQYVAATWKGAKQFDSTWSAKRGPVTVRVGADKIVTGLDQALVDAPVGSQLLVIVPPELGFAESESKFANATLIYVVDVLAASADKQ